MSSQGRPEDPKAGLDQAEFDALVRDWKDRIYRLARRFFRRPEDAEEVVQEVFLRMHRSLSTWRADAPFEHWILRIATNVCTDALRERRRRPASTLSELSDDAGDSLDAARSEQARLLASDLLGRLPPKDRWVVVLMDLEGWSAEEIAAVTGSTRGAVKLRAFRARRALRRLVDGVGGPRK